MGIYYASVWVLLSAGPGRRISVHIVSLGGDPRKHWEGSTRARQARGVSELPGSLPLWVTGATTLEVWASGRTESRGDLPEG